MTSAKSALAAFVIGALTTVILVVQPWNTAAPDNDSSQPPPIANAIAQSPDESSVESAPRFESAHDERVFFEARVRDSGVSSHDGTARELIGVWRLAMMSEGAVDAGDSAILTNVDCYAQGCILSLTYSSWEQHDRFQKRQQVSGGLLDVWPGSKFCSGPDTSGAVLSNSWILYLDDLQALEASRTE